MPVHKYRRIEDMEPPAAVGARALETRIRALWNRAFLLSPPSFPRGVTRFRSIEEANERRASDTAERMRSRATRK
jgi:hypothetical protein